MGRKSEEMRNWAIVELYCGESGKLGYYNSQELGLARALASNKINVTIVYPDKARKKPELEQVEERICILRVPCRTIGVHAFYNLDFLVERGIEVVHLDSDNQMFAPKAMRFLRKHHIFFYNYIGTVYSDTENPWKKSLMKLIANRNIAAFRKSPVVAKTAAVRRCLEEQGVTQIETIPVGLDTTQIKKESCNRGDVCRELGLPEEKQLLLFVGRLEAYKRPFAALELLKELGAAYYLVMIGTGSLKAELRNRIRAEGLERQISYFEKIPNRSMYQYYQVCDYYINFNTHEIFGMSILEAMYQRCTVVARRAPGPEEIIENGISGYLCATDEEMKQVILSEKKPEMGKRAEERILTAFTWEQSARRLIEFVRSRSV